MPPRKRYRLLAPLVHTLRVAIVAGLLLAIPSPTSTNVSDGSIAPTIDQINLRDNRLAQSTVGPEANATGMWPIVSPDGKTLAWVARTLPAAKDIVGYRGPTEASIVLTPDLRIQSVAIVSSADTEEHVQAVASDPSFFEQFRGWSWGDPPATVKIDAVSGATLTSLALAEGLLKRLGSSRPSLVFPDPLQVDEIKTWYPDATSVEDDSGIVRGPDNVILGRVLRTGPLSDDVIGYQGPSELLLQLSPDQQVMALKIRRSFDNEPYVDYVRQERGFWSIFRDMTIPELAAFSPKQAGVEGVSGATMTSQSIAETMVQAATAKVKQDTQTNAGSTDRRAAMRFSSADIGTLVILVLLAVLSRFRRFHRGMLRRCWLATVVIIIGLWSGNLISLALIAGWSAEGVAWRLAPALAMVAAVTLLTPPTSKHNPYCNHLCPHGAIQQWVIPRPNSKRRLRLPVRLTRLLRYVPGLTLVIAYLSLTLVPSLDLSAWEPFHAYLFRVAGWGSIGFAFVTLFIAARVPMAYCRFGCPTGRLLDHLRRTAVSDRIQFADMVAVGLLVLTLAWRQIV